MKYISKNISFMYVVGFNVNNTSMDCSNANDFVHQNLMQAIPNVQGPQSPLDMKLDTAALLSNNGAPDEASDGAGPLSGTALLQNSTNVSNSFANLQRVCLYFTS